MAKTMLLEIGTEEMPALFMPTALADLKNLAEMKLGNARLSFDAIKTLGTPRRMAVIIENLAEEQAESVKEVRGPRLDKAYNSDGNPTQAAIGFARGQGIAVDKLKVQEVNGVKHLFAVARELGLPARQVLPEIMRDIVASMSFAKSMRWGYSEIRFARPIRWITAMYDNEVIPFQIENVLSSNRTYGHRFLAPGAIELQHPREYAEKLRQTFVIVDLVERKDIIWKQVQDAASQQGGHVTADDELLEEVNFLVEYPTAFLGRFSENYLTIPSEVLVTSMKEHQRYFPVIDNDEKLMPCFVGVRNGTSEGIDIVRDGNQRVLKARLEDAYFFYREDTSEPLASKAELLKNVVYQERLGTIWAKTVRLQKLAAFLNEELGFANQDLVDRAALLCKADLETAMVYEFPELQGIMGRNYALAEGEDPVVAAAIYEHYLPRFSGDELPETPPGTALSLAEKLDNLVGNFAIGVKPTGSQDPYALRRQAIGIAAIILGKNLSLDLDKSLRRSYQTFSGISLDLDEDQLVNEVMEFILLRFRNILQDEGLSYDVLDAVLTGPSANLLLAREKALALADLKQESYFSDLMIAFNRPYNLARKATTGKVDEKRFEDEAEIQLFEVIKRENQHLTRFLAEEDYKSYFMSLADLRPALDIFFERIMVMVEDEAVRENRLAVLKQVVGLFSSFADFSKLVQ